MTPPAFAGRRTEKRSEVVARQIVQRIVDEGLDPGTKLPAETVMSTELQVGRATLREALRILEVHGLITIRPGPGGGPVIAGAQSKDFGRSAALFFQLRGATYRELAEARYVLEPLTARLAAERQDAGDLARLEAAIDNAKAASVEDDQQWAGSSTDFHDVVAGMSGNRILDLFGEAIKELWFERIVGVVFPSDTRQQVRHDHEEIADAIASGDAARAERAMQAHMAEFLDYVVQRYPGILDEVVDWH